MALKNKFLAVVSFSVALVVATATILSTQASIDFWFERPDSFSRGLNHITVFCENGGGMDGDFFLKATFVNASVLNQTEMPFARVNDSTVRLQFVLHRDDSKQRTICFKINDTEGFSVTLTLERTNFLQYLFLKANAMFPTMLNYKWDSQNSSFTIMNQP
jgi:hypothetical protein